MSGNSAGFGPWGLRFINRWSCRWSASSWFCLSMHLFLGQMNIGDVCFSNVHSFMYSVRNIFNIFGCLSVSVSACLFARLPVRLCLCQPVPLSVCLFVSLSDVSCFFFRGEEWHIKRQLIEQSTREWDGERVIERERENEKNKRKRLWTWTEQKTKTLHDWQERKHYKTIKNINRQTEQMTKSWQMEPH